MTLSFPIPVAEFAATLRPSDYGFELMEALEKSEGGDGSIDTADFGPRLWSGGFVLSRMHFGQAEAVKAVLDALTFAGRSFQVCDPVLTGPAADPAGSALGAATPSLLAVPSGGRTLQIQGLPTGYQISRGDKLSFVSTGGAVSLHRVVTGGSAGGAGNTGNIEVVPNVRSVAAPGDPVTLVRPYCLALIRPGSVRPGRRRGVHVTGMAFDWVERL